MRLLPSLALAILALPYFGFAQGSVDEIPKLKHEYQSDVARLRKIVINSLYSNRDAFLRELISNANDALEKLRIVALTDKDVWDGTSPLNVTIKAESNPDGNGGRIIITDTGIGMNVDELTSNLGILAKSGTSDFVARVEGQEGGLNGNLIGAFGVGFYSSFLVADKVTVASIPPKSSKNPHPTQNVFSSSADESSFEIYPDPRGNTLGHGTEITLELKSDASDYLHPSNLMKLIHQHSSFSTSFPIYLWNEVEEEVSLEDHTAEVDSNESQDEEEALVEETNPTDSTPKTKKILVQKWEHINSQPPLWMRDPKTVSDEEYELLYQATFKDFRKPLAWNHFTGDSGSGVSFRAIIYIPSSIDDTFFTKPLESNAKDVRLLVKHVFITSDLGEYDLPKWASWVRVIIDAEDLPLNVSRETLQSSTFLKQIRGIVIRRLIQLFAKIAEEEDDKFAEIQKVYRTIFKLGATEDEKNRQKIATLVRFSTNQRNSTSLDNYIKNKKQGQKQIFYLADMGKSISHLTGSVFVEKLDARGYEVLLLNEPVDEILVQTLRTWKGFKFQDVAKAGLVFGDDTDEDREAMAALEKKYAPLLEWLKVETEEVVRNVVLSDRLVTSPCAVVADSTGITANVQRLMSATNRGGERDQLVQAMMKKQKVLEVNPRSPLIEGLLHRVEQIVEDDEGKDRDFDELREVASILIDGAFVRSGFEVADSNKFLSRVDRVLRRSLGVSETAPTDATVKPAPPVDPEISEEIPEDSKQNPFKLPDWIDEEQFKIEVEEIDEQGNAVHDEL
ncbi:Hsp90 protein-domain-containing protein [Scleroderma yunnanense]